MNRPVRPDLPRAIVALFCQSVAENPTTKNISLIEVLPAILVRQLPATLPPVACVFTLVGGQPSRVYATKLRILDPHGKAIYDQAFVDLPFTTQIKRNNAWVPQLTTLSEKVDIIREAGRYKCQLIIEDEPVGTAEIEIILAPQGAQP